MRFKTTINECYHMKIIRILAAYVLIVGITHLGAMEFPIEDDREVNESMWDMLPDLVITKIAACCDPATRNRLMNVSRTLSYLASKQNGHIVLASPLFLGKEDSTHYMITSCIKGQYRSLCNLLNNGVDPNSHDCLYATPLSIAEQNKHSALAALLRNHEARELIDGENGQSILSAFVQAVYCNEIDFVEKYLSEGVDPNEPISYTGVTPLHIAIYKKHTGIIKRLLAYLGIQINIQDNNGETALCWAAIRGFSNIVKFFLLRHRDIQVNKPNNRGATPLMLAAYEGHFDMIKLLLTYPDIQANLQDDVGSTALIYAVSGGRSDIVKLLLEHPHIQVNLQKNNTLTALLVAIFKDNFDIVKLLIAHSDILVNLRNNNGPTVLMYAVVEGHSDIVERLLAHPDVQVNIQGDNGYSALLAAVKKGYFDIVKLLLAHPDIQVNLQEDQGGTALIEAVYEGHSDIVRLLLQHPDVQVNTRDNYGYTALDVAKEKNHGEIVSLLQAYIEHNDAKQQQSGSGIEEDNYARLTWCVLL